jgi:hypothetical protein
MTVTVLDSADLVESVITGTVPVPKGIAEDNAAQAAKRAAAQGEGEEAAKPPAKPAPAPAPKPEDKSYAGKAATRDELAAMDDPDDPDNQPEEDGISARQRRIYTLQMQSAIRKKHYAQREAEEAAASEYNRSRLAEERAARLEQELAALKAQHKPAEVPEGPPERAKFASEEAYQDALIDYRVDQKLKARAAEDEKRAQEREQAETLAHARANIERAIELVPDFKEVTEAVDVEVPPHLAGYLQGSEMFAELGYHFAKHPEVLAKLTEFTAHARPGTPQFFKGITRSLVELGKIESTLSPFSREKVKNGEGEGTEAPSSTQNGEALNGEAPRSSTGSAPSKPRIQAPIIRPLNAGSAAQVDRDEADMTGSQVITAWQRKHGVKLTARKRH